MKSFSTYSCSLLLCFRSGLAKALVSDLRFKLLGIGLSLLLPGALQAQTTEQAAVRVHAVVRSTPSPQIKLVWAPADTLAATYTIWRKAKTDGDWGTPLATLPLARTTQYADNSVTVGTAYEYRVRRTTTNGEGYVFAGIEVPVIESRGTVILLVADTNAAFLSADLSQLQSDLVGDGWEVIRHDVAAAATPPQVKALIKADYLANPTKVKSVFLLGHVAVPYSGLLYPDGHPDHWGAWPADIYYADMHGTWTDSTANDVTGYRPENHNTPHDGKFDQTTPPLASATGGYLLDLQVGRVDLSNLPAFSFNEAELLQRYLRKDHQFRHKVFSVTERGLVDDHFGSHGGEYFANNGWRNYSALLGDSNTTAQPYFATLATNDFLMAYACGGGSFTSMSGVGGTSNFAAQPVKAVFNMFFGSYFGDWDNQNNLLRASIAGDGYSLTNCWAGRPNWEFHHMGLGETVGYATYISQTAPQLYTENYGSGFVHAGLLGDPTLRLHPLAPPSGLLATQAAGLATLTWGDSPTPVLGYYVYRATSIAGPFVRLTPQPITATTFNDLTPVTGNPIYMVRALELRSSPSGTYYNLSQGVFSPIVALPAGATWLGRTANWAAASNWSTVRVPDRTEVANILPSTPHAPVVSGTATIRTLNLLPGAQLTVAAGGSLLVRDTLLLSAGASGTRLSLADASATLAGGRLRILEHPTPAAGLLLGAGSTLAVGNGAELTLLGDLGGSGGTASFSPLGQLVFAHDSSQTAGITHSVHSLTTTSVGILKLPDSRDILTLNSPLTIQTRVENIATIITNNNLTLLSRLGRQGVLAPVVPALGQPLTLGTYTGNVQVQVYIDGSLNGGYGYRHLTTPVGTTTFASLGTGSFTPTLNAQYNTLGGRAVPFPTVFWYDQSLVGSAITGGRNVGYDQGWVTPTALTDPLLPGSGYISNMAPLTTLAFTGPAQTTPTFSFGTLLTGTNAASGWHLLGNPYAAPLDWDHLTANGNSAGNPVTALYVFKSDSQYGGAYGTYLPGVGGYPGISVNGGSPILPVGQGFFMRATAPGTPLTISLADLVTSPATSTVQRTTADTRPRLMLALRNASSTVAHQTAIYFQAGATTGNDATYDATSLANTSQALSISSETLGVSYSINGLPALTGADVLVPLQLSATAAGTYSLAVETLANLPGGYHAYLRNGLTGAYTDLALAPGTTVTLAANVLSTRYTVIFTTQQRALATSPAELAAMVTLYPNPAHGTATLHLPQAVHGNQSAKVEILNSLGQVILSRSQPPTSETLLLPLNGLAAGIYLVKAYTVIGVICQRLVVE